MKFITCILFCVLLIVSAMAATDDCPTICTSEYRPVCAKNEDGELKTFATACNLKALNCLKKTNYVFEKDGAC